MTLLEYITQNYDYLYELIEITNGPKSDEREMLKALVKDTWSKFERFSVARQNKANERLLDFVTNHIDYHQRYDIMTFLYQWYIQPDNIPVIPFSFLKHDILNRWEFFEDVNIDEIIKNHLSILQQKEYLKYELITLDEEELGVFIINVKNPNYYLDQNKKV